jgi:hypothetical protein
MIQRDYPGAELLEVGLADLAASRYSAEALAICAMPARLRSCGVPIPEVTLVDNAEIRMYRELGRTGEGNPHLAMNGILRRLDAYASTAETCRHRAEKNKGRV